MYLEITVTIMAVAFLLLAAFAIPSLLQIRRTAETLAATLRTLNENLPAILRNLEHITASIDQATVTAARRIDSLSDALGKLQQNVIVLSELGRLVRTGVRHPLLGALTSLAAVIKGVRVFLTVLSEKNGPADPSRKD